MRLSSQRTAKSMGVVTQSGLIAIGYDALIQ
ncbi:MAG: hypothetical protein A4E31_00568 [Methanomassiliicoccales archaeon PtaU1.Bin030]|nr:MAG: hypothetical protein A4E31_00568 [Methanomassiliicoccales archaeon PtaU1.Bin030]